MLPEGIEFCVPKAMDKPLQLVPVRHEKSLSGKYVAAFQGEHAKYAQGLGLVPEMDFYPEDQLHMAFVMSVYDLLCVLPGTVWLIRLVDSYEPLILIKRRLNFLLFLGAFSGEILSMYVIARPDLMRNVPYQACITIQTLDDYLYDREVEVENPVDLDVIQSFLDDTDTNGDFFG